MVTLIVGLVLPVSGQTPAAQTSTIGTNKLVHPTLLPYTAIYKITRAKTLADGSIIASSSTQISALDTQGRRMTSKEIISLVENDVYTTQVGVFDPVALRSIEWNVPGQKATATAFCIYGKVYSPCPPKAAFAGTTPHATTPYVNATSNVEDLGVKTIQGVEARGRRAIITTPAGMIGNKEPMVGSSETWKAIAPELDGLLVRVLSDDPQQGKFTRVKFTMELVSFKQGEPDSTLFYPPVGYEIINIDATEPAFPKAPNIDVPAR